MLLWVNLNACNPHGQLSAITSQNVRNFTPEGKMPSITMVNRLAVSNWIIKSLQCSNRLRLFYSTWWLDTYTRDHCNSRSHQFGGPSQLVQNPFEIWDTDCLQLRRLAVFNWLRLVIFTFYHFERKESIAIYKANFMIKWKKHFENPAKPKSSWNHCLNLRRISHFQF